ACCAMTPEQKRGGRYDLPPTQARPRPSDHVGKHGGSVSGRIGAAESGPDGRGGAGYTRGCGDGAERFRRVVVNCSVGEGRTDLSGPLPLATSSRAINTPIDDCRGDLSSRARWSAPWHQS